MEYTDELLRAKILECQWNNKHGTELKRCGMCYYRFSCHLMKAKKFQVVVDRDMWIAHEVYAESRQDAYELYYEFSGEDDIVPEVDCGGEDSGAEIKEIGSDGMVIDENIQR